MAAMRFGKRGTLAPSAKAPPQPTSLDPIPTRPFLPNIPLVSLSLLLALSLLFVAELNFAPTEAPGTPSLQTLIALGGIGPRLVFAHHQWWRVFTAPFLHVNLSHLLSNGAVLLLTGILLERVIGRAWVAAIYAVGALAGSIGSLLAGGAMVSVGASGAIMALLAAVLVWCIPFEDRARGRRLRRTAVMLFIGALLPSSTGAVDIGAHAGGAVAGGVIGLVLRIIWPETDDTPGRHSIAWTLAGVGLAATIAAFSLNSIFPTPDVGQFRQYIPAAKMPKSVRDGMDHAEELVRAYPDDPRSHLLRALVHLDHAQTNEAQAALRTALAKSEDYETPATPDLRRLIRLVLSTSLLSQNRNDEARAVLAPGDCARAHGRARDEFHAAWQQLHDFGICR